MDKNWAGPALRVGLFGLTGFFCLLAWGFLLSPLGMLVTATLSVFGAGAAASALALRIYEGGRLTAIGFGWHPAAPTVSSTGPVARHPAVRHIDGRLRAGLAYAMILCHLQPDA